MGESRKGSGGEGMMRGRGGSEDMKGRGDEDRKRSGSGRLTSWGRRQPPEHAAGYGESCSEPW